MKPSVRYSGAISLRPFYRRARSRCIRRILLKTHLGAALVIGLAAALALAWLAR